MSASQKNNIGKSVHPLFSGVSPEEKARYQGNKPNNNDSFENSNQARMQKKLDSLFSYEGTKYGDMPSYKSGGGGGQSLDRLAQMMGGQIFNPYQYSRMISSGRSSGSFPYESAIESQRAGAASAAQREKAKSEADLLKMRGEQEMAALRQQQKYGVLSGLISSPYSSSSFSSLSDSFRNIQRLQPSINRLFQ